MKKITMLILLIFIMGAFDNTYARDFVVILDAGHGGKDPGACSEKENGEIGSREKDITLAVVKKLGKLIEREDGVKVFYTRKSDVTLMPKTRMNVANSNKGDLYISIHVNSAEKNTDNRSLCCGAETYILGPENAEDNFKTVSRENGYITKSDSSFKNLSFEEELQIESIQQKYYSRSLFFAEEVQKNLAKIAGRINRGVKQDRKLYVLYGVSMPSVLVELDFICNPEQEQYLVSEKGQEEMAMSIYKAFITFVSKYKK